jgi:hypothetical protein
MCEKLANRKGGFKMQNNKKPWFSKKGKSEDFNCLNFQFKMSLITGLSLLIMIGLYEAALWLGLV